MKINKNVKNIVNPLRHDPTKRSNTFQQFVGYCRPFVGVCLTTIWDQVSKVKGKNRFDICVPV